MEVKKPTTTFEIETGKGLGCFFTLAGIAAVILALGHVGCFG